MQATINTKIDSSEKALFESIVEDMGLTQSVVLRNFIKTFNKAGGFPYNINYVVGDEERISTELLESQIEEGSVKTYETMGELWNELDNV